MRRVLAQMWAGFASSVYRPECRCGGGRRKLRRSGPRAAGATCAVRRPSITRHAPPVAHHAKRAVHAVRCAPRRPAFNRRHATRDGSSAGLQRTQPVGIARCTITLQRSAPHGRLRLATRCSASRRHASQRVAAQVSRRHVVGSSPETHGAIEDGFGHFVDLLDAHLAVSSRMWAAVIAVTLERMRAAVIALPWSVRASKGTL